MPSPSQKNMFRGGEVLSSFRLFFRSRLITVKVTLHYDSQIKIYIKKIRIFFLNYLSFHVSPWQLTHPLNSPNPLKPCAPIESEKMKTRSRHKQCRFQNIPTFIKFNRTLLKVWAGFNATNLTGCLSDSMFLQRSNPRQEINQNVLRLESEATWKPFEAQIKTSHVKPISELLLILH